MHQKTTAARLTDSPLIDSHIYEFQNSPKNFFFGGGGGVVLTEEIAFEEDEDGDLKADSLPSVLSGL